MQAAAKFLMYVYMHAYAHMWMLVVVTIVPELAAKSSRYVYLL